VQPLDTTKQQSSRWLAWFAALLVALLALFAIADVTYYSYEVPKILSHSSPTPFPMATPVITPAPKPTPDGLTKKQKVEVEKIISKRESAPDGNTERQYAQPKRYAALMNESFMLAPGQKKESTFTLDQPARMLGSVSLSDVGLIVMSDEQLREYREGRCGDSCDVTFFSETDQKKIKVDLPAGQYHIFLVADKTSTLPYGSAYVRLYTSQL